MKLTYQAAKKERLDKFLSEQLPDITRSQLKKIILNGQVTVNDQLTTVHHWLKNGDVINLQEAKEAAKPGKLIAPKIIDQTEDYLVINKPAGLLVHPTERGETNTLADWLKDKFPEINKVGDDPVRPGIMHRLDKEASGLMVIALNQPSFNSLKKQFQERKVSKEYYTLIYGRLQEDDGVINRPLERNKKTGLMIAQTTLDGGKEAVTQYEVVQKYLNYTLLKVKTLTGRQHQIRAHLYSIGHSLVGDKLYVTKDLRKKKKTLADARLFLHASYLKFRDRKRHNHEYHSALPKELENILSQIK